MKKLVIAAVVCSALTSMALESSNLVGYQNLNVQDGNDFVTTTFLKIGTSGKTLSDYTPVSARYPTQPYRFSASNFYLTFLDKYGAQRLVKNDEEIIRLHPAAATDPDLKDRAVVICYLYNRDGDASKTGWFLTADVAAETYKYRLDNYRLQQGDGFMMYADSYHNHASDPTKKGVTLTFSGEVDKEDQPFNAFDGNMLTGNMTPATLTLGSLTPVSARYPTQPYRFSASNFYLTFIDKYGAQRLVKNDPEIVRLYPAAATDPDLKDRAVVICYLYNRDGDMNKTGWFLTADVAAETFKYKLDNYEVKAGEGFMMYADSYHNHTTDPTQKGVTITFKSPIPQE